MVFLLKLTEPLKARILIRNLAQICFFHRWSYSVSHPKNPFASTEQLTIVILRLMLQKVGAWFSMRIAKLFSFVMSITWFALFQNADIPEALRHRWFGGGTDFTLAYIFEEDAKHFHLVLTLFFTIKIWALWLSSFAHVHIDLSCCRFKSKHVKKNLTFPSIRFKKLCDNYFYIKVCRFWYFRHL